MLTKLRSKFRLDNMAALRLEVAKQLAQHVPPVAIDRQAIQRQIKAIDAKLATASDRIVSVAPSLVATIEAKMLELQTERAALATALATKPQAKRKLTVDSVLAPLIDLDRILTTGTVAEVRAALSQNIAKVTIKFEPWKETADGRKWRRPTTGVITLLSNGVPPSERTCPIGTAQIPLSRQELASCVRQRAWNGRDTLAV